MGPACIRHALVMVAFHLLEHYVEVRPEGAFLWRGEDVSDAQTRRCSPRRASSPYRQTLTPQHYNIQTPMSDTVCVYCSSSDDIDDEHFEVAEVMGRALAEGRHRLVYGGGQVGLMGRLAESVHERGGNVVGVIPEALRDKEGVAYDVADEMVVTGTMQERKAEMYSRADAFVALPGGFGTLEEFMEVLTLKQLGYHRKPLVLINTSGFYDALIHFFEQLYDQGFARQQHGELYHLADGPEDAMTYLEEYRAAPQEA